MKTVVFIGPSLPAKERHLIKGAVVAQPVRRGDLARFVDYDLFVIIDGEFGQNLSVSPKEILNLLDSNKTVIGAASMGALRASELDTYGMIGIGWVYRRFAAADVRRDDDVALCYSPFDLSPTTVPMVDLEYRLEVLLGQGKVSRSESSTLLRKARSLFFADRTQEAVNEIAEQVLGLKRHQYTDASHLPSVKALDAVKALELALGFASGKGEI